MSNASDDSREPLVEKHVAESKQEQPWMVYLSTFVAVCGSFAFGSCVSIHGKSLGSDSVPENASLMNGFLMQAGYSSPAQAAIRNDLSLTIAEVNINIFD